MPARATLLALAASVVATAAQTFNVWPLPQQYKLGSQNSGLDATFTFQCAAPCPDPLPAAMLRYEDIMFFAGTPAPLGAGIGAITGLSITVGQAVPLSYNVSEAYTLSVPVAGVANLTASTQWGALRGLETFAQLFTWAGNSVPIAYTTTQAPLAITDAPRWPYRGMLIDSARHFLTVSSILITLDGMAANKLNTLHWHITDDESWPLVSATYPNFTQSAYAPDATYSHADVQTIVQYAWERGIRVIPEFDMPAHASAWAKGYPASVISCPNGQTLLNPIDDGYAGAGGVYDMVSGLLDEFTPLFGNDFIHFGGDEVEDFTCWDSSPAVQAFAKAKGLDGSTGVRNYFQTRIQGIAAARNLSVMFWEEVFDGGYTLAPSTIVDVWLSYDEVAAATAAGHRVVSSFGYYLDQQQPFGGSHYFWADTWQNFFLNDPTYNTTLSPAQLELIIGGSISQWGEQVDAANIQSRIWPRACGGAERLWTSAGYRDVNDAEGRLEHQRCHMVQRGIGAGPIRPSADYVYCPVPSPSRLNFLHGVPGK